MKRQSASEIFSLSGRTAMISGATGWLGSSMAKALANAGCRLVISSRNGERAKGLAADLSCESECPHVGIEIDQLDCESIRTGFAAAVEAVGQIDVLVNNGLELVNNDLTNIDFDEFARHQINNAGYFELARSLRDHAVARGNSASIIMIGSIYGSVASYPDTFAGISNASSVAYHAVKGATLQMTRHLAVYWAKDNVRVNCLSPGPFPRADANPELVKRLNRKSPMHRVGRPEELSGPLLLLASDAGSYITGHDLVVDGGWTAW